MLPDQIYGQQRRPQQPPQPPSGTPPGVVYQGGQPTMGAYNQPGGIGPGQDPALQAQHRAAANQYARARLMQLQRVAAVLPPELRQQLGLASGPGVDPALAWRQISGAFANASRQAGFQDPRYYLRYVLPQMAQMNSQHPNGGGV